MLAKNPGEGWLPFDAAVAVKEQLLLGVSYGYIPNVRPATIISTRLPSSKGLCPHPDCGCPTQCRGNIIMELSPPGPAGEPPEYALHVSHHKTRRWGAPAIEMKLPAELGRLLHLYLHRARPVLVMQQETEHGYLFVTRRGLPLNSSSVCILWGHVLARDDKQLLCNMTLKQLRHVSVSYEVKTLTEAMAAQPDGGAASRGLAMGMGNSTKVCGRLGGGGGAHSKPTTLFCAHCTRSHPIAYIWAAAILPPLPSKGVV